MKPKVSVCIQTYNQTKYIRECLDSVFMQKTNFDFEVLIGEDDSKDGTREICIEYAKKYPQQVRLFLNDRKNVIYINGQPTGRWNLINNLKHAQGKYIALCEGDDYWTDPYKLQRQVDFLENNPDYVICLHNTVIRNETQMAADKTAITDVKDTLVLKDFIDVDYFRKKGGLVSRGHTSSIVFRNHLIREFPKWFYYKSLAGDIYLLMLLAQHGKGKFINEFMSVYRVNPNGLTRSNSTQKGHLLHKNRIYMLKILNEHFQYKYNSLIKDQIADFHWAEAKLYAREKNRSKMISHLWLTIMNAQYKLAALKRSLGLLETTFRPLRLFSTGVLKIRLVIKQQWNKIKLKRKKKKVAYILAQQQAPSNYDDEKVFQLLQSQYKPRDGYKYDYFHSWKRGVERASSLLEIPKLQQKGIKFLEVACGDAMTSYVLSTYGHEGHCHDIEDWRHNEAKKLKFFQADLKNGLPIDEAQYDLIFSFNAFEYIPDPAFALQEISRVAKPGAVIYIAFGPLYNSPWGLHAYRTLYMPYPQFIFSETFYLNKLQTLGVYDLGEKRDTLQPLNKWNVKDFDAIWEQYGLSVESIKYGSDLSHLDIILNYPHAFRGRNLNVKEITTPWIKVILLKK